MSRYYRLEGRKTFPCAMDEWKIEDMKKTYWMRVKVSTVFLGMDHSWGNGPPLIFETMIFGGKHDMDQERYSTYSEAKRGHLAMCRKAFPIRSWFIQLLDYLIGRQNP